MIVRSFQRRHAVETLSLFFGILPAYQIPFKGRLAHFQRLGFPAGVNLGKGIRAEYTPSKVVKLALAMELSRLGLLPEFITAEITRRWPEIAAELMASVYADRQKFVSFNPSQFGGRSSPLRLAERGFSGIAIDAGYFMSHLLWCFHSVRGGDAVRSDDWVCQSLAGER